MNADLITTGEAVYWGLRDYLGSRNCPWKDCAELIRDVKDCLGPGKCAFERHCYLCLYVDSFPQPQKSVISGEIEELRWEIRAKRGETPVKCPTCGVIKATLSAHQPLCLHCSSQACSTPPIAKKATEAAMQSIDESVELLMCPRLGSQ